MLSRAMIDQARRVAWRCRPRMSGARARAWARADRETFGISREGVPAETGGTRRDAGAWEGPSYVRSSGRSHPEHDNARRVPPPASEDEAGRNDASGRRRFWWNDREDLEG